jgi:hypothetical protein
MVKESCEQVCKTLASINDTLINVLVEKLAEVLEHINSSLEMSGKVNEHVIEELKSISSTLLILKSSSRESDVKEISEFINNIDIVRDKDRSDVVDFLQRISIAVGSWSAEERNAVIELVEDSPSFAIKTKKRIKKVYLIIATAGLTTILSQLGLSDGLWNLLKTLFLG